MTAGTLTHRFNVTVECLTPGGALSQTIQKVEAAYFKTDGDFISFKDSDNKVVYHVRSASVLSIERVTEQGDGQVDASSQR